MSGRRRPSAPTRPSAAGALLAGVAAVVSALAWARPAPADNATSDAGRAIYLQGVLPSGRPLEATVQGDVRLQGLQAACGNCHRRSGFGSTESNTTVPPVVGALLYKPVERVSIQSAHKRSEGSGTRPAYTDETLARAIRHGIDAAGRPLAAMMPRYTLADAEVASLIAYLKSLSPGPDPGVTATTVHLATVVTEGVDPARRRAMLDVLTTFVAGKNGLTRNEIKRRAYARRSGMPEQAAYRTWELQVWELTGGPESWRAQLEARYSAQPVFALISGLAAGPWEPIHEFCEANAVPCLFPNTDLPATVEGDFYTFYFSRGLTLEADALAARLLGARPAAGTKIVQVFRSGGDGEVPAAALRRALAGKTSAAVEDLPVAPGVRLSPAFWRDLLGRTRPDTLVLWLHDGDLAAVSGAESSFSGTATVVLSTSMVADAATALPRDLGPKLLTAYPFDLPEVIDRRLRRVRVWLQGRGIAITDERLQANTLFAATLAGDALSELLSTFVRALFVEDIEHMVDSAIPVSAYPRLTLGPGERFASKGCYLLRPGELREGAAAEAAWVVP